VSSVVQFSHHSAKNCPALPFMSEFVFGLGYNFGYTVNADDKSW
jgi:hypothetical protein